MNRPVLDFADQGEAAPRVLYRLKGLEEETSQEGSMQDHG